MGAGNPGQAHGNAAVTCSPIGVALARLHRTMVMICHWLMVAVGLVLTVGTGFFVASEFALVNLDRNDLEGRERAGEARLGPTIRALRVTSTHYEVRGF
jgi:hypothetical protein